MIEAARITAHYASDGLLDRVKAALAMAGLETGPVSIAQLAPLDHFHVRGLAATVELGKALAPTPRSRVLDIGAGLGGPSRHLAATHGCHVTGIDLNPAFVAAACYLAARTGLADKVEYRYGDALALPFEDKRFDLAVTQHVAMDIADRTVFYAEAFRVLRPGGRLAIYDVLAGPAGPLHFPVPWSRTPETSFLMTPAAMRAALEAQGFEVESWTDRTDEGIAWLAASMAATGGPPRARPSSGDGAGVRDDDGQSRAQPERRAGSPLRSDRQTGLKQIAIWWTRSVGRHSGAPEANPEPLSQGVTPVCSAIDDGPRFRIFASVRNDDGVDTQVGSKIEESALRLSGSSHLATHPCPVSLTVAGSRGQVWTISDMFLTENAVQTPTRENRMFAAADIRFLGVVGR